jgi:hypothetical protein
VWDSKIPEFYSVPTVWAYSLLKAVEKCKKDQEKINFARLYLKCLIFHRQYLREIKIAIGIYKNNSNIVSIIKFSANAIIAEMIWIVKKIIQKININHEQDVSFDIFDTQSASELLSKKLLEHPIVFELR